MVSTVVVIYFGFWYLFSLNVTVVFWVHKASEVFRVNILTVLALVFFLSAFVFPFLCSLMQFLMWVWELCDVFPCHMEQKSWNYLSSVLNLSWKTLFAMLSDFFRDSVAPHQFYNNISFVVGAIQFASERTGNKVCRNLIHVTVLLWLCLDVMRVLSQGCARVPQAALSERSIAPREAAGCSAVTPSGWWETKLQRSGGLVALIRCPVPGHLLI